MLTQLKLYNMKISALTKKSTMLLAAKQISATARTDVEILLVHTLKKSRAFLYTYPEYELKKLELAKFNKLFARRKLGEPIAYILGKKEFWSLELTLTKDVLIPRPETELLVELALEKIAGDTAFVADIGTGSGAIALALAKEKPEWQIFATDLSKKALAVAAKNAKQLHLPNIIFLKSDLTVALPQKKFAAILSNPPYIPVEDPHLKIGDLRFEPHTALVAGKTGLEIIEKIIQSAPQKLEKNGWLMLEHGFNQGEKVRTLFKKAGFTAIKTYRDYAKIPRATIGRWK